MLRRIVLITSVLLLTLPQCVGHDPSIEQGGTTSKAAGDDANAAANQTGIGNFNEAKTDDSLNVGSSSNEQTGGVNISWQPGPVSIGVVGLVVWGLIGIFADRQETRRLGAVISAQQRTIDDQTLVILTLAERVGVNGESKVAIEYAKSIRPGCRHCRKAA